MKDGLFLPSIDEHGRPVGLARGAAAARFSAAASQGAQAPLEEGPVIAEDVKDGGKLPGESVQLLPVSTGVIARGVHVF